MPRSLHDNNASSLTKSRREDKPSPLPQAESVSSRLHLEPSESSEEDLIAITHLPITPRTISPACGGLAIDTFDWNAQQASARIGQYRKYCTLLLSSGSDSELQC